MRMKLLTLAVAGLATLYGGGWFAASSAVRQGALGLIDDLRAEGWTVAYDDLTVRGFPSRVDTSVTGLALSNGLTGWQAPFFQVFALAWRPTEVIAVWPPTQVLTLAGQQMSLDSDGLRASAKVAASTTLALQDVTAQAGPFTLTAPGWETGASRLLAAFRQAGPGVADYDVFLETADLRLPAPLRAMLDPGATRPAVLPLVRLDAAVTLAEPLNRFATGPTHLRALTLRGLTLDWGDAGLTGTGSLAVGRDGIPEGQITLTLRNWPALIAVAVSAGVVPSDTAEGWAAIATPLARGGDTIDLPLIFAGGLMSLGPIPLGPAPRLGG